MNQPNRRTFRADFGNFKFTYTIEDTAFYLFERVASDLARQYAKKLFGRQGNIATLREGRHCLSPQRYWNYEGYIGKFDKFGIFIEGRCIDFNFTEVIAPVKTETRIHKRLRLLNEQFAIDYSIPELRHQALQTRLLANADYYDVCPIPAKIVTLADVLLE